MKKFLIGLLAVVLILGAALGIVLGVRSCNDKNENNIEYELTLIEDKYAVGDIVMFRYVVTADVELTKMVYILNDGSEVEMTVKTGKTEDLEDAPGDGEFYIDTGVEMIDTADMNVGNFVFKAYAYDAEENKYNFDTPHVFELVAASTAA